MLSVFGKELGVQRQSQVALLLLLVCIVLEIVGKPFREINEKHAVLERLELSSLLVEFGTLWCGLMIYQSGPKSEGMNVVMTVCVIFVNVALMLWFLVVLLRAYAEETKKSALFQGVAKRVLREWDMRRGGEAAVQERVRRRTVESGDLSMMSNPLAQFRGGGTSRPKCDNKQRKQRVEMVAIDHKVDVGSTRVAKRPSYKKRQAAVKKLNQRRRSRQQGALSTDDLTTPATSGETTEEATTAKLARALYAYTANDDGEIDLMEGDAIDQVEDFGEGWLYGRNERTGEIGNFPSSFCTQGDLP